ncbi:MAG: DUF1894 domain-containing protein [Methanomicrobiales archaeon]|nr:DUF1894 domain-containing protein [Methanomicrobiales archaeon]
MGCIESMKHEIIARQISFTEASSYIRSNTAEVYEVPPGFKIFDVYIIGIPPILLGIDGTVITFPYTKPCHGTFLLRIDSPEEAGRIRAAAKRVRK